MALALHLEILPPAQRRLWNELYALPGDFALYGGTALALRLGHRSSVDFDFFSSRDLDLVKLEAAVPFLRDAKITQRERNTLSVLVEREGPVKVSFFGVPALPRLLPPAWCGEGGIHIASLLDLAGTKASVVQVRAEAKDYVDIDALITQGGISLSSALSAAQALYGASFNPQITLKSLSYFDDGDLRLLPDSMKQRLVLAAREVDLDNLPDIGKLVRQMGRERGLGL